MTIRDELARLVAMNNAEQNVPEHIALQQLEHFGDDLIPGLIECLTDVDAEVRRKAVGLLDEARPRSNVAVPALIERMQDEDWLVQVTVLTHIGHFGPIAAAAIPHLEPWLDSPNEFLRMLALSAIMRLDPNRTDLLPDISEAMTSREFSVRSIARDFFGDRKAKLPFDEWGFKEIIRSHWLYHTPGEEVHWSSLQQEDGMWLLEMSPVFQELAGGNNDGKKVWAEFEVDFNGLAHESSIAIQWCSVKSEGAASFVSLNGEFFGEPFALRIHLKPMPDSEIREVVDVVGQEVRAINDDPA